MSRRLAKRFGLTKPREKLRLNEYGEYISKYGDWLPNAKEIVYDRDRKIWEEKMFSLREQYQEEYYTKFAQRLAEYTRQADCQMYEESLKRAQKQERRRLRNIRIGALSAANEATKARMRMDQCRIRDIINYDTIDQKRDIIREMIYEKPSKNWISKENFESDFHTKFLGSLENVDTRLNEEYGLPNVGDYDTIEGLFNWSDKYFESNNNSSSNNNNKGRNNARSDIDNIDDSLKYTRISKQPIPMYKRKNDTMSEYSKERVPWQEADFAKYSPDSIEYEKKEGNLMENYWYKLDFDSAFYQRQLNENIDKSSIFHSDSNRLLYCEFDNIFEDFRLLSNEKYWHLLKNYQNMNENEIMNQLNQLFNPIIKHLKSIIDNNSSNAKINVEINNNYLPSIINDIISMDSDNIDNKEKMVSKFERQMEFAKWRLYKDFYSRINHCRNVALMFSKMNFDSGMRRWRKEVIKWRYMLFNDKFEHLEWRQKYRNENYQNLSRKEYKLINKAKHALKQLKKLTIARRQGVFTIEKLINSLDDNVLKLWYIWFEDLCENGEQIVYGQGWSYNRYQDTSYETKSAPKPVPIEYYNLPDKVNGVNITVKSPY